MSAPAAGGTVAMQRLAIGLAAVLLIIGVIAAQLWLALRSEREQGGQLLASQPAQAALEQSLPVNATLTPAAAHAAPAPAGAVAREPARAQPAGDGASLLASMQDIANNPQSREFARSMMVMTLSQEYADLASALGISREQADRLIGLLADQRIGVGSEPAIEALLGAKYPQWKEYERGAAERQREQLARRQADTLRAAIDTRENPLSEVQFEPLAAALAAEQRRIDQESRGQSMQQQLQRLDESNRRLADVAAVYLNPGQLERYRRHLGRQAEMARAVAGMVGEAQGVQAGAAANTAD